MAIGPDAVLASASAPPLARPAASRALVTMLPDDDAIELSIVMPCLDEAKTIEACVAKALGFLERRGVRGEVVIGDNGSSDGSQALAEAAGARVVAVAERGYGAAIQGAVAASRGRYFVHGDADDTYDFSRLDAYLDALRGGADLVMGNRFAGGIAPGAMPPLHRYLGTPVLSFIGRLFFGHRVGDVNCGLRGLRREAYERMALRSTGMEFASEMVAKASLLGMRIDEVPTTLDVDRRDRPPHLRTWRDGWRHLRFLLLYSPRWLFLLPGMLMIAVGLLVGGLAWADVLTIGPARLGVHTLAYAGALVMVGQQAVQFAVLTKTFAITEGLLPDDPGFWRRTSGLTLEAGLLAGIGLLATSAAVTLGALATWRARGFGPLDEMQTMRFVIPAIVAFVTGASVILSSFYLSLLRLRRR